MIKNRKYLVLYRAQAKVAKNREFVGLFMDEVDGYYLFSLRPLAGTQRIPKDDVLFWQYVDITTPPVLPRPQTIEFEVHD